MLAESVALGGCLTSKEAASHLKLAVSTLAKLRLTGAGPKYLKLGRAVRYRLSDLADWQNLRIRCSTTESARPEQQS
jgi:predicted DNA-binding transcriptional regulator AlpA